MDFPDFSLSRANLFLWKVYGDHLNQNNRLHLDEGVTDNDLWKSHWYRMSVKSSSWYAMTQGATMHRFTAILAGE